MDGDASAQQIADYYNMSVEDFLAYADEISAEKAGDTYNRAIDTSTIAGAGTLPTVTEGQVDTIIGDTTAADAAVIPETGAWDTSYIADDAGTLEAGFATAEQENRETQAQAIRDYVTTNYGDGPYTQEQALAFAAEAKAGNVPAGIVASALGIPLATIQAFYDDAGAVAADVSVDPTLLEELESISPAVDGDYSQTEIDSIVSLIDGGADRQQIADYYGMTVDELMNYYATVQGSGQTGTPPTGPPSPLLAQLQTISPDVDGDYSQDEVDAIMGLIDSTGNIDQIADYYNMTVDELMDYYGRESQRRAEAQMDADEADYYNTATVQGSDDEQVDDIAPDRSALIRDYVTQTFGDPPYTQEQAIEFSKVAIENNVPAQEVADALNIDVGTVQSFYNQAVGFNIAGSIGDDIELGEIGVAGGGRVGSRRFMTSLGPVELANGGIADLPVNPEIMQPMEEVLQEEVIVEEEPYVDYPQLIEMTVEAIKGNVEDADAVINQFIEEYGIEKFQMLRDAVLKLVAGNPEAQTEGMIVGTGGGMDDQVMGVIGEQQDIAVSPDEYIFAADVVSGLGDGSSQAGADILDQVAANVRAARSGGRQPAPINLSKVMSV